MLCLSTIADQNCISSWEVHADIDKYGIVTIQIRMHRSWADNPESSLFWRSEAWKKVKANVGYVGSEHYRTFVCILVSEKKKREGVTERYMNYTMPDVFVAQSCFAQCLWPLPGFVFIISPRCAFTLLWYVHLIPIRTCTYITYMLYIQCNAKYIFYK
jgi:hypothetical protein